MSITYFFEISNNFFGTGRIFHLSLYSLTASDDGTARLRYTPEAIYEWLKTANIPQLSRKEKKEPGIE
jgi:hypothetical protein